MYHDVVPENSLKFDQDLFKNHPTHGAVVPLAMFVSEHAGDGQRRHREDPRHAEQRRAGPEVDDWEIETN